MCHPGHHRRGYCCTKWRTAGAPRPDRRVFDPTVAAHGGRQPTAGVDGFTVMCDEAHRTTGVTLAGDDENSCGHDGQHRRRPGGCSATATPRDFHREHRRQPNSPSWCRWIDELTFGPEPPASPGEARSGRLHRPRRWSPIRRDRAPGCSRTLWRADVDDASKIVGCWNGLGHRSGTGIVSPVSRRWVGRRSPATSRRLKQVAELF